MDKVGTLCQLTIGGIGTTGFAFSGGLHHLATHASDRHLLVADPTAIPRAIDGFLHMFMGAPNMARRVAIRLFVSAPMRSTSRAPSIGIWLLAPAITAASALHLRVWCCR